MWIRVNFCGRAADAPILATGYHQAERIKVALVCGAFGGISGRIAHRTMDFRLLFCDVLNTPKFLGARYSNPSMTTSCLPWPRLSAKTLFFQSVRKQGDSRPIKHNQTRAL